MVHVTLSSAAIAAFATVVSAHPEYVALLPNGDNVPNVPALGHVNVEGGGARNDFGKAFYSAGKEWNAQLCQEDSDGDGQTNGQELGDPCCEWVANSNPTVRWTEGVSHPGNATLKSDPTLWADIVCSNDTSTATSATSTNATTPTDDTTSTTDSSTPTAAPTPTATSAASSMTPAVYSAFGLAAALVSYFL